MRVGYNFRIWFRSEVYELLNDIDVVRRINLKRLRCLGYVVCMVEDALASQVFDARICGSPRRGGSYIRWKDQIEEALSSIGVTNWDRRERMYCGRMKLGNRVILIN